MMSCPYAKNQHSVPIYSIRYRYIYIYSGIRLLATRVLLIKWLVIREVVNKGTELTQNIHLGPEDWLLIEQCC